MKNKFFRSKLFSVGMIIFLMLFISACSNKPGTIGEFIYTAGWYTDASVPSNTIACYWKNGVKTDLTDVPIGTKETRASVIYVSGSDVYVGGSYVSGANTIGTTWINGDRTDLIDVPAGTTETRVESIFVSGPDLYVAGSYTNSTPTPGSVHACYWKNGVKTDLTDVPTGTTETRAFGIYVSGSVVYVAGHYINGGVNYSCYWNADTSTDPVTVTEIDLPVSPAHDGVTATSIYVSGSYVYVAGSYTNVAVSVACYWNADTSTDPVTVTETDLTVSPAPISVTATSIYVSNSVVYVADSYINSGVYAAMWQDGAITTLTELIAPAGVTATSIYMIGSDVYVGGSYTGASVACYWKNGVRADLPAVPGYTAAQVESIFVTTL